MGIRTVGAWICGWDWHNHATMYEDLNYLVSLYPTYQQLTRLSPFPGTPLWDRLQTEGRVADVPWEDVHFWSGAQKNSSLEPHETLNLTEYGYNLLYQTWGPSLLRRLDIQLNGYRYCRDSNDPMMRRHRALYNKRQASLFWCMVPALDRFAPNGVVRRRVRVMDAKYRALIGEPTPLMVALGRGIEALAASYKARQWWDPANRHPKQEPYKRYVYNKHDSRGDGPPYDLEVPTARSLKVRLQKQQERLNYAMLETLMGTIRRFHWRRGEPERDDYLTEIIRDGRLGFGF